MVSSLIESELCCLGYQFLGNIYNTESFEFGFITGASKSCSLMLSGRMLIFGGTGEYINQISEIANCGITRTGNLPMTFEFGACNTFTDIADYALLCFSGRNSRDCHK